MPEGAEADVKQGDALKLTYAATFHEGSAYDPANEYASFLTDHGRGALEGDAAAKKGK